MSCRGICKRYKGTKGPSGTWYTLNRRCNHCAVFIKGREKIDCPCCGYRMRSGPRSKKYKEAMRARI